jgi:acyl-CoA-binding protein
MIPESESRTMLWVFGGNSILIDSQILVRTYYTTHKITKRVINDQRTLYAVDDITYDKWKFWHSLKAKSIQTPRQHYYEIVYKFDTDFFEELSNLSK